MYTQISRQENESMVTFLTLPRQYFLHTTPIDVINSWGISKMYATPYHHDIAFDELGDVLDSMIETGGMSKEVYQAKVKDFVCSL